MPIVSTDPDYAEYLGDDTAGVYFARAQNPDNGYWYMTAWIETEHIFNNLYSDEGPYPSEAEAYTAGLAAALTWCADNVITIDPNDLQALHEDINRCRTTR